MSVLVFIIVLSILIVVHEYGHFAMAKFLKVKVERFALGFGPKLFSRMHDGTEFALCLIPLGGYVKMAGDERAHCCGKSDEFYTHSPGHRSLIVLMGPIVNFILAYLCFVVVFLIGFPAMSPKVGELIDKYPAQAAGMQVGDKILRIDSKNIESWEDMQQYVTASTTPVLNFVVLRSGQEIPVAISPRIEKLENIFGQKENIRLVGIRPTEDLVLLKYGPGESLVKSYEKLREITFTTYKALYRMATGAMSAKDSMTGPIGIFYIIKRAAELGFTYVVFIMGIISASLAIFNLLPFPVLDGGHLVLCAFEKIRGHPLSQNIDDAINRVGVGLIICLAVFVFYSDFVRFGIIDKVMGVCRKLGF